MGMTTFDVVVSDGGPDTTWELPLKVAAPDWVTAVRKARHTAAARMEAAGFTVVSACFEVSHPKHNPRRW